MSFIRSPSVVDPAARRFFDPDATFDEALAALRAGPIQFRDNVARVFSAARIARHLDATWAVVEGWRISSLANRRSGQRRRVTGTSLAMMIASGLRFQGLLHEAPPIRRQRVSRCTIDEAHATSLLAPAADVMGIAGRSCPSAPRAARYLTIATGRPSPVLCSDDALSSMGLALSERDEALLSACRPTSAEHLHELAFEAANWSVHLACRLLGRSAERGFRLESRLAAGLRTDRPA